ncbi:MAG: hypothetical protein ACTHK7_01865 [Aureliella sp.]
MLSILSSPVVLLGLAAAAVIYLLLSPKKPANAPQLLATDGPSPGWPQYRTNRDAEMAEDAELIREHFCNKVKEERIANALAKHGAFLGPQAAPAGKSAK